MLTAPELDCWLADDAALEADTADEAAELAAPEVLAEEAELAEDADALPDALPELDDPEHPTATTKANAQTAAATTESTTRLDFIGKPLPLADGVMVSRPLANLLI